MPSVWVWWSDFGDCWGWQHFQFRHLKLVFHTNIECLQNSELDTNLPWSSWYCRNQSKWNLTYLLPLFPTFVIWFLFTSVDTHHLGDFFFPNKSEDNHEMQVWSQEKFCRFNFFSLYFSCCLDRNIFLFRARRSFLFWCTALCVQSLFDRSFLARNLKN